MATDIVFDVILFATAIVVGLAIKFGLAYFSKKYHTDNSGEFSLTHSIFTRLGEPINWFIPLLVFNLLMPFLRLRPEFQKPLDKTAEILFDVSVAFFLIAAVKVAEDYVYHRFDIRKEGTIKTRKVLTQLQFVRKLVVVLIVLVIGCVILLSFNSVRKVGASLLTGVGVGGIIIGFAAQKSLGAFLAGFQIAFTQPIRIDDQLVVEGEWGRVEEITLTYVVVNCWDQRRLILPITYFIEKPFQNWTRNSSDLLAYVMFYLDYTAPIEAIRAELDRILEGEALWDRRVKVVQVTDLREHVMEVRVLLSARNAGQAFDLRCAVREKMIRFLQQQYPGSLPVTRLAKFADYPVSGDGVSGERILSDMPGGPSR